MSAGTSVPLNKAKVTEEFARVLEQILKRSLSTGDTSPYERQLEAVADLEIIETLPAVTPTDNDETPIVSPSNGRHNSYKTASQEDQLYRSSPESDDVQKDSKTGTHSSTGTSTMGTLPRMSGNLADDSSDSSEQSNVSRSSNKKKKSFFKKARERIRESFKRSGINDREKSVDSDVEVDPGHVETSPRRRKRKQKKQKENGIIGRKSSNKSSISIVSPGQHSQASGPFSEVHTHTHTTVDHALSGYGDVSGQRNELHIEKTHQSTDIVSGEDETPSKHIDINFTLRESHPAQDQLRGSKRLVKEEKEPKFLDALRKLLKKRSTKGDKDRHKRSKSADDVQVHGIHPVDLSKTWIDKSSRPKKQVTRVEHHHVTPDVPLLNHGPGGRRSQHIDEGSWQQQEIDATFRAAGLGPGPGHSGSYPGARSGSGARNKLHLPGLNPKRPNLPSNMPSYTVSYDSDRKDTIHKTQSGNYLVDTMITQHQTTKIPPSLLVSGAFDRVDGATLDLGLSDSSVAELGAKPFADRTADEKDKMYTIIADKLNLIADHYHESKGSSVDGVSSPSQSVLVENTPPKHTSRRPSPRGSSPRGVDDVDAIKKELAQCLRVQGDNINTQYPEVEAAATELAVGLTYSQFEKVVDNHVHREPSVQNIANFLTVAKSAMKLVGATGAVAQNVKEMTLRYFEDKFAEWVFNKGGWESVVEDIDSGDPYSELD